jgi:hypothetical protein
LRASRSRRNGLVDADAAQKECQGTAAKKHEARAAVAFGPGDLDEQPKANRKTANQQQEFSGHVLSTQSAY